MRPPKLTFRRGSVSGIVIVIGVVALSIFAVANQRTILDHISVWQFKPSSAIANLVTESGMNSEGRFLYYASEPQIDGREDFNAACRDKDSTNAILGCYVNDRIYIFNVTDKRLDGIKATTAAHEMLHAAYDRLTPTEKKKVDSMVDAAYAKLSTKDGLKQRMAIYAKTEPGERDNELHSVLGTEVADLPHDLEVYYSKYFSDRSKVVAEHAAYQSVFTSLQARADAIQAQMKSLQASIELTSAKYSVDVSRLQADISSFNSRAEGGQFSSQSQFESERSSLVARSNQLEIERQSINSMIDQYNSLNSELSAIAAQDQMLNQSINSKLPAAPSVN